MSKPRVGLDITPLFDHPTGVTRFVSGLLQGLAEDPLLEVGGWILSARPIDRDLPYAASAPADTTRIRIPARLVHRAWAGGSDIGSRRLRRFDVVHGTNFAAPPGPRSVISLHDLTLFDPSRDSAPDHGRAEVIRRAISTGAHLVVPTDHIRDRAVDVLEADRDHVTSITYGLTPIPQTRTGAGHDRAGMSKYVLALGTVNQRKNLVCLIQAMESMPPDLGLVVAGAAGDDERDVRDALDTAGRRRRVRRLTEVDDVARAALLRDAELLAYPSLDEGFGFPPLEAMSVGVPVVAARVGSIPEVVGDAALLIDPTDRDSLSAAMHTAISPDNRSDLVAKGHAVAGRYDWKSTAREIAAVYHRVAAISD